MHTPLYGHNPREKLLLARVGKLVRWHTRDLLVRQRAQTINALRG